MQLDKSQHKVRLLKHSTVKFAVNAGIEFIFLTKISIYNIKILKNCDKVNQITWSWQLPVW